MIPPTLDAFRALMKRVQETNSAADWWNTPTMSYDDERAIAALATATPAQLLAIVGAVQEETVERPDYYGKTGRLIVTPREDA